jgi:phosphoglycolate phosphatase-like HAD superfamily hydrolase
MAPMPQFGASTIITADVRLILLDCFETLVELDHQRAYRARKGVLAFLAHYQAKGVHLAVASDSELSAVSSALAQAGLERHFARIYHAGNAMEDLGDGRTRKRLDLPLADHGLDRRQVVFIGDSPLDAEAALHHRVPFIRIPRSEDRNFSFTVLISGPSRYNSGEFSAAFLEQYLKDRGPKPPEGT